MRKRQARMSEMGQKRKSGPAILTSVLPSTADIRQRGGHVQKLELPTWQYTSARRPIQSTDATALVVRHGTPRVGRMVAQRQTRKNSVRAYVFRFAPQTRTLLDTFGRANKFGSKKNPSRRYRVFFEVRADLAWVARSISGGGCCSPAIAHQTLT